jgi:hypothetical protein
VSSTAPSRGGREVAGNRKRKLPAVSHEALPDIAWRERAASAHKEEKHWIAAQGRNDND